MLQSFEEQIDGLDLERGGVRVDKLQGRVFPGDKMVDLMKV
jgi:hypothetical protein